VASPLPQKVSIKNHNRYTINYINLRYHWSQIYWNSVSNQ
jgi:hypothetical protein